MPEGHTKGPAHRERSPRLPKGSGSCQEFEALLSPAARGSAVLATRSLFFINSRGLSTVKLPPPSFPQLQDSPREPEPYLGGRDADGRLREASGGLALTSLGRESSRRLHAWSQALFHRRDAFQAAVRRDRGAGGAAGAECADADTRCKLSSSPVPLAWSPVVPFWAENKEIWPRCNGWSLGVLQKALQPCTSPAKLRLGRVWNPLGFIKSIFWALGKQINVLQTSIPIPRFQAARVRHHERGHGRTKHSRHRASTSR